MDTVKPYRVHTRVVIDMATMKTIEDEYYWSTVPPAMAAWVLPAAAIASVVIGGASAVYSANQGRYSANMQQDYLLQQAAANQKMADFQEQQRQLELQALYEQNAYQMQLAGMQEARYAMMLQMYGMEAEIAAGRAGLAAQTFEIAGQRFALEQEMYDWQIATIDWEADFKEEQARFLEVKGSIARELFGTETAKLMARERARMAAAGLQITTGSPVAVLGQLQAERDFSQDIMKFETDINAWEQRFDKAQLLNQKNKVKFGEYGSGLDYKGDIVTYKGNLLDYEQTMAGLGERAGEAGLGIAQARLQQGLLGSQRVRIGQGAVIDLNKYLTQKQYSGALTGMQSNVYGSAAGAATVGGYFNTGAAIFNGINSYYTARNKNSGRES